mgnify:CR=1 FL=1
MAEKKEKSQVTKYFIQRIQEWLDSEMERDAQFKARVESVKDTKTVEGACNYVLKCAKDSGQCGFDDAEVYGMVRHFFDEDDVKDPGDQNPSKIVVSGHVDLTQEQIKHYVDNYSPFDKAGAYGIQEWIGCVGVTSINGSYYNVMGLPVQKLYRELLKI